MILGKHAEPLVRLDAHGAGGRLDLARQTLEERRLSGSVGADEPIAVARRELDVHLFEQGLAAERDGKVLDGDHAARASYAYDAQPSRETVGSTASAASSASTRDSTSGMEAAVSAGRSWFAMNPPLASSFP